MLTIVTKENEDINLGQDTESVDSTNLLMKLMTQFYVCMNGDHEHNTSFIFSIASTLMTQEI